MTGQELFAALSFVDERYIMEAEKAYLGGKIPWAKWLSVAACLCILLAGAFALENLGGFGVKEEAAAPAAPAETLAAASEAAPPMQDEMVTESVAEPIPPYPVEEEVAYGELHHVAFAQLRILDVLEDGSFEVYVARVAEEPGPIDAGETLTLVIDPEMIPTADRTDLEYSGDITADMLVEIHNGAYDAGINTLYAEGVLAAAQP